MNIQFFEPLTRAWERMKHILWRPFDLAKWLVLGFSAWLAGLAGSGGGQNNIDKVVVQQIDLIHIEQAAVGAGQQTGLDGPATVPGCLFKINPPGHPVFGGIERQSDDPGRAAGRAGPAGRYRRPRCAGS